MRLQVLHQDVNANEDVLQFPSYLFNIGEGKLEVEEKESNQLPSSGTSFTNISIVINRFYPDIFVDYHNNT